MKYIEFIKSRSYFNSRPSARGDHCNIRNMRP